MTKSITSLFIVFISIFSLVVLFGCGKQQSEKLTTQVDDNKVLYDEGIKAINDEKYGVAIVKLDKPANENYKDAKLLQVFSKYMVLDYDPSVPLNPRLYDDLSKNIPDNYSGDCADLILLVKSKYRDSEGQIRQYLEKQHAKEEESKIIKIGMSKDDVIQRWGKPDKINKTTTKYGISEQWVYPGYKYVYFDNGAVTAKQE